MKMKSKGKFPKMLSLILSTVMLLTIFPSSVYADTSDNDKSTVWIVGDSTVSGFADSYYYPRYGWGTQVEGYLDGSFNVENLALSGRSSKSFTTEPQYQTLLSGMKKGDVLLVGFGHNDEKPEVERYTNPNGSYKEEGTFANSLYENYIKPAQAVGCTVILSTPIVRRTATGTWADSDLHTTTDSDSFKGGNYSQAIIDLGKEVNVPVVDMTSLTKNLYDELGFEETINLHAWTSSKPESVDNTHTNIWGAKYNAYLQTKTIKELNIDGVSEHIIDATAPTKSDTLVSNPDYVELVYNDKLEQSKLWPDYGIWKGTAFGDIGGDPTTENFTLGADANGDMQIKVANNKGKIGSTVDGLAMYYYKVPVASNFSLTAKAKINSFDANDQVSFGLMARDEMYVDFNTKNALGDYVVAGPLKLTQAGGVWNDFARKNGVLTQGGTAKNEIKAGDTVDLSIVSNSDGYACTFGNEETIAGGFDFKLTSIDSKYVYVGMFASRNADISFSDIKLVVDGVEVANNVILPESNNSIVSINNLSNDESLTFNIDEVDSATDVPNVNAIDKTLVKVTAVQDGNVVDTTPLALSLPIQVTFDLKDSNVAPEDYMKLCAFFVNPSTGEVTYLGGRIDVVSKTFVTDTKTVNGYLGVYVADGYNDFTQITLQINSSDINVNGVYQVLDTYPVIKDSTTFVPVRVISEGLGAKVSYDADTKTAIIEMDNKTIKFSPLVKPEGSPSPIIVNERMLIPVRFVSESFGANVNWFASDKNVQITK